MLVGVEIEHELDERPLETGAGAVVGGESGAGDLGATLEVEDPQVGAEVPVRLGLEVECMGGSPTVRSSRLAASSAPTGTLSCGKIGQAQLQFSEVGVDRLEPSLRALRSAP